MWTTLWRSCEGYPSPWKPRQQRVVKGWRGFRGLLVWEDKITWILKLHHFIFQIKSKFDIIEISLVEQATPVSLGCQWYIENLRDFISRAIQLHIMSNITHIYPLIMPFSFYLSSYILSLQLSYNIAWGWIKEQGMWLRYWVTISSLEVAITEDNWGVNLYLQWSCYSSSQTQKYSTSETFKV